jgi:GxxExxY protein
MTLSFDENLNVLTEKTIGCTYAVGNGLGHGFLEKVYENALALELEREGLKVTQQWPIKVLYRDAPVGEYFADLLVEDRLLVELKAAKELDEAFHAQCLNYLKATGLEVCLLINFGGPEVQVRRVSAKKEWVKGS